MTHKLSDEIGYKLRSNLYNHISWKIDEILREFDITPETDPGLYEKLIAASIDAKAGEIHYADRYVEHS